MATVGVVKRKGTRPTEPFDHKKLHASVKAACLSVHSPEGQAHDTASSVCTSVIRWLESKAEVTSEDIRRQAARALADLHPDASYLYQQYREII